MTTASPVPSVVSSLLEVVDAVCGKVDGGLLRALASSGVKARRACCTRLPSWPSTSAGTSLGVCVTKKMPTPLERMSRTVVLDRLAGTPSTRR